MKLSTKTRYAVRAVFDIAYHGLGRTTQARDIARRQEVPLRYLEQIFGELRRAKLIEGKRGPTGGYLLSRTPETITIGDIIRATQGPIELLFDDSPAEPTVATPADGKRSRRAAQRPSPNRQVAVTLWKELAQKVGACFDDVTVRDLCHKGEALGLHRGDDQPRHMYFI